VVAVTFHNTVPGPRRPSVQWIL